MNDQFRTKINLWTYCQLAALIGLMSCNHTTNNSELQNYFYPVETWENEVHYHYIPSKYDNLGSGYIDVMRKVELEGERYLVGNRLESDSAVINFFNYKLVENGVLLNSLSVRSSDTLVDGNYTFLPAKIMLKNYFPYGILGDTTLFTSQFSWEDPTDSLKYELVKRRRFLNFDSIEIMGEQREMALFELQTKLSTEAEGFTETEYRGIEVYAKNLGLVYVENHISEDLVQGYVLVDTIHQQSSKGQEAEN